MLAIRNHKIPLLLLIFMMAAAWLLNISLGSVHIPLREVVDVFFSPEGSASNSRYIIVNYRIPKAITAVLAGSGLGVSGLLMQTLFRNPLAGPYVLGISSGASLGVALVLMGASLMGGMAGAAVSSSWALVLAASAGSLLVLFSVLLASLRLKDTMAILIIGLMFASLTSALVSVLAYFSPAAQLQQYVFWTYGSVGDLSWPELGVLGCFWGLGIGVALYCTKDLNSLLLGEQYAKSMGTRVRRNRILLILATSLLAGSITAFAGPIAFVGLAVPHLVRQMFSGNDHRILLPAVIFGGAILMLMCDTVAQLPGTEHTLPINAVTSVIGAPVVIWLLVRKRKFIF